MLALWRWLLRLMSEVWTPQGATPETWTPQLPPPPPPVNLTLPVITGQGTIGQTVSASTGTWLNSPTGFAYQWLRDGAEILGAISSTYILTTDEGGTSVTVRVTASNDSGSRAATSLTLAVATLYIASLDFSDPRNSGYAAVI